MRIALGIEYDGTDFYGWQRLSHGPSVQAAVEQALSFVADEAIEVTCAGRTDSGVHALCQVVHFDTTAQRSERGWILGVEFQSSAERRRALGETRARRIPRPLRRARAALSLRHRQPRGAARARRRAT